MTGERWTGSASYDRFMGRWSEQVAERFLAWLEPPRGARWLDVGCGTGALSGRILDAYEPARLVGIDPSPAYVEAASERLGGETAEFVVGDAEQIPAEAGDFDVVVSGLVLNFVPDPGRAGQELARVVAPGGRVAAYVWDYAEGMEFLRVFWDAAAELDPEAARLDEGSASPVTRSEGVAQILAAAGLEEVETTSIEIPTRFPGFDDFWSPFLGGQGTAGKYAVSLSDAAREALRGELERRLPREPDGAIELAARAWATRARRPG